MVNIASTAVLSYCRQPVKPNPLESAFKMMIENYLIVSLFSLIWMPIQLRWLGKMPYKVAFIITLLSVLIMGVLMFAWYGFRAALSNTACT
jgi:hypothetical protein